MFRTGYILSRRGDLFWFLGLPFLAVGIALVCQQWLTAIALASVNLWITIPHHFATWLRTYGLSDEWARWKDRLLVGPIAIFCLTMMGLQWAPITTLLIVMLWDHQHSLMQQHGFARIYDFKAQTGATTSGRFDLAFGWIVFGNMLLNAPLFVPIWLRELYRLRLPLSVETVQLVQSISWSVTGLFLVVYLGHAALSVSRGSRLNPLKYLFLACSYGLWYFTSWHTESVLVFGIAHRLMHGLQYCVIVYLYMQRRTLQENNADGIGASLIRRGHITGFVFAGVVYAVVYQLITGGPLSDFGFGAVTFTETYSAVPQVGLPGMAADTSYDLFANTVIHSASVVHFYFDSFIWKVSDQRTQRGL